MRIKAIYLLLLFPLLYSCDPIIDFSPFTVEGYIPVYSKDLASAKKIVVGPPRTIINAGKIYTVGSLLFQVEQDSGIHVINYADPANPQKLGFIKSFLCKEITVKNGYIYTNNMADLVVIDIRTWNSVREVKRVAGVFPELNNQYPPKTNQWETVYFVCPNSIKGIVTGWKKQTITNPKCWR